jgi:K+-transporting ATPase ATPase C chain
MKSVLSVFRAAALATLVLTLLCGGAYPLIVFGIAQLAFRDRANGSLIVNADGRVRGSSLLAQAFTHPTYFHPRPSAAGNGYDAANSGGSNLGPTSRKLNELIRVRVAAFRQENGLPDDAPVPADAVTASGSGLDPHISPETARLQIARVAAARHLPAERVLALVEGAIEAPQWGFLGDPRVNVLRLNLALDRLASPGRKE